MRRTVGVSVLALTLSAAAAASAAVPAPTSGGMLPPSDAAAQQSTGGQGATAQDPKQKEQPRTGKERLSEAERKIDSHVRDEIARRRGHRPRPLSAGLTVVEIDEEGRALVEIRARILTQLQRKIERLKGTVVSSSLDYRSLVAWVPLLKLERLAEEPTVSSIDPAPQSITVRPPIR